MEEALELASIKKDMQKNRLQRALLQHVVFWTKLERECNSDIRKRMCMGERELHADFINMTVYAMVATFYECAAAFDVTGAENAHAEWKTYQSYIFNELFLFCEPTRTVRMVKYNYTTGVTEDISGDDNMAVQAGDNMLEQVKKHESVLAMIREFDSTLS